MEPDEPHSGSIDDYGEHWVADARAMILDMNVAEDERTS